VIRRLRRDESRQCACHVAGKTDRSFIVICRNEPDPSALKIICTLAHCFKKPRAESEPWGGCMQRHYLELAAPMSVREKGARNTVVLGNEARKFVCVMHYTA
jgi:hypothetical protein